MRKASSLSSVFTWLVHVVLITGVTLLMAMHVLLFWWADPSRRGAHWLAQGWGHSVLLCQPSWRFRVRGRRHLHARQPYIYVANHQSLLDIMVLFCINQPFKWVAKESLFRVPLLGWSMSLAKYIPLARAQHGSIRETYQTTRRWLASGMSVFFFPEGTRSPTSDMLPFKNGAFKLAMQAGVPVVPIAVTGTRDLLPRNGWRFGKNCRVRIAILPPLDPRQYPNAGALRDAAKRAIEDALQAASTGQAADSKRATASVGNA